MQSIDKILGDLSNGVNFAATLRKVSAAQHEEEDSDVDLDFNPEESSPFSDAVGIQGFTSFANQLGPGDGNSSGRASISGPDANAPDTPTRPRGSASRILMQQPLHLTILQHARVVQPGTQLPPSPLHVHHNNALSRAVVNTIGRLGRWKRVLSSRAPGAMSLSSSGDSSTAFDLELNATGDLFSVRGGVEQYLKMIDPAPVSPVSPDSPESPERPEPPQVKVSLPNGNDEEEDEDKERDDIHDIPPRPASPPRRIHPGDSSPRSIRTSPPSRRG